MSVDTPKEVEIANALLGELTKGTPIHGGLRATQSKEPYPLVTCGVHCTECNQQSGGALDFSGEVGCTKGTEAVDQLLRTLADRGCSHARAIMSSRS